jgi:ribosome-binding protein aMBF1 (putative translation factor)
MKTKTVKQWLEERGLDLDWLTAETKLDAKVVVAIAEGRYTPSPQQRQRIASALEVEPAEVAWGHINPIAHVYGHGPQFGRSP